MDVPAAVDAALDGESVAARIPLRGEDALFVTATRTLAYRADGLLSDESVTEYSHAAERITVAEGRRKSKVTLDYGLEGEDTLTVPAGKLDDALHPIIAGVLNHADVTAAGETVKRTYRFSELTLIVTSDRLVKHVGAAVWDEDYEEIVFGEVTDIDTEEGNVASQLVLETTGRTQRIKAPNDSFRDVRETVEDALFAAHDADDYQEFRRAVASDRPEAESASAVAFDNDSLEPLGGRDEANDPDGASAEAGEGGGQASAQVAVEEPESSPEPEPTVDVEELRAELDDLAGTVDQQAEHIAEQEALLAEQSALLEEQRERIEALRETIRDQ
ncbi:hypothetical protein [Salarchaeum sp. JOR-1]|uniref:DUF7115 domain-containing protein n=1 Tax=Salarchaeum sp. JOR-1 TaxID=2599399 RepID=UPI001198610A|nr:hypothetical protein [Salarchaeum sp. JOR-1]QDX40607.1 hypothetical protein FQU85_06715 [Salarchaeum sp. JOR-1]